MGKMERGGEDGQDMRHSEREKQRHKEHTVTDQTKLMKNSKKLAPSYFSTHFE